MKSSHRNSHAPNIDRRRLLQGLGSSLLMGTMAPAWATQALVVPPQAAKNEGLHLASSIKNDANGYQLLRFTGSEPKTQTSGWRGHQAVASSNGRFLVSVARRPDTQLLIEDLKAGSHYFVDADDERHFYGHGLFTPDNRWFYAPENDYENVRGVIGKYDVQNHFKKVSEWDSQGVGPHQIAFLPQQGEEKHPVMVVANGGIETHPDYPRIKLNPETMQPNISYLDSNGQLLDQVEPPHHQLSLRHLDISSDGQVWTGAQYQGEIFESPNLVYSHRLGENSLTAVKADDTLWPQLKGYIASVSCHPNHDTVCITAPRDNLITFWRRSTGQLIAQQTLADCAGVCAHPSLPLFYVSSGSGDLAAFNAQSGEKHWQQHFAGIHWDNHLTWTVS